jgi:NAD(P)-dependent dehydrogenase (short-subunit alcohol dehydrogenase family)
MEDGMDLQLNGKLALVTGSTAGIGLAIAGTLAGEGCRVIVNGRGQARVDEAIGGIRTTHPRAQLEALVADLATQRGAETALDRFPELDILINNLGTFEPRPFEEIADAEWQTMIEVNFMSGVRLSRHHLPRMKTKGWGRIIFIASESAVNIPVEMVHYGVTKTMQVALARGLAETTAEIAAMVAFVASPLSSATNGAAIRADGGLLRSIL